VSVDYSIDEIGNNRGLHATIYHVLKRHSEFLKTDMETSEVSAGTPPTSSAEIAMENSADCSDLSNSTTLLMLNEDAFQEILTHLTYDEVARLRMVCKQFNEACQKVLNKGFMAVQRYHNRCLKEMKAKLPRRESERRAHPLARHIDVLTGSR